MYQNDPWLKRVGLKIILGHFLLQRQKIMQIYIEIGIVTNWEPSEVSP